MKRTALILLGALALVWPAQAQGPVAVKRLTNDRFLPAVFQGREAAGLSIESLRQNADLREQGRWHGDSAADGAGFPQVPCWSPDGKQIVFAAEPGGDSEIFVMQADGSDVRRLTNIVGDDSHPHWSADGARILFNSARTTPDPKADWGKQWHELFSMKPDGSDLKQHTKLQTVCTFGSFSPDLRQIVYRNGRWRGQRLLKKAQSSGVT